MTQNNLSACEVSESQNRPSSCVSNDSQCTADASPQHDMFLNETQTRPNSYRFNDSRCNTEAHPAREESTASRDEGVNTKGKPDKQRWKELDNQFSEINKDSWIEFTHGKSTPEQFATDLTGTLISFLQSKPEFRKKVKEFFKHKETEKDTPLEEAKENKRNLVKKAKSPEATEEEKFRASQAVRIHAALLKYNNQKDIERTARDQNKAYERNFWKTAKDVTNGTFGQQEQTPTYDKTTADNHYRKTYESKK